MDKVIIIAEAGVNHNGDIALARQLIDAAAEAGADYVKFQTWDAKEGITSKYAPMADYQKSNTGRDESQSAMLSRLALGYEAFSELRDYCRTAGVKFLSTPFDIRSVDFLASLGMDYMKIPSGDITNLPYLRRIAATGTPVIMSTGMSSMDEVGAAMEVLTRGGLTTDEITLLHCNTEYPTPMEDVNLGAMDELRRRFGTRVGYSDHTRGTEVAIAATALGAGVIEKHFTLSRELPGPDHVASLEPHELRQMVSAIRNIEKAVGGHKGVTASERKNIAVARKSIVAARDIRSGELLSEENLTVKRPAGGLSPMLWDVVVGQRALRDFARDELIEL